MYDFLNKMSHKDFKLSWVASICWFLVFGPIFSGFFIMIFAAITQGELDLVNLILFWFFSTLMIYTFIIGISVFSNGIVSLVFLASTIISALLFKAVTCCLIHLKPKIYLSKKVFIPIAGVIGALSTTLSWLLLTININTDSKFNITAIEVAPTGLILGLLLGRLYFENTHNKPLNQDLC